jgi:hypothetical protein
MFYVVTACQFCNHTKQISLTMDQFKRWGEWKQGGGAIQDLLPDLSPEIRELFVSGMCPDCWNKLVGEEMKE